MFQIEYFAPGATAAALTDEVEADSGLAAAQALLDNNYYDALSCCHSTMDRSSYTGCRVVIKAPNGARWNYEMEDDAEGGPPHLLLTSLDIPHHLPQRL